MCFVLFFAALSLRLALKSRCRMDRGLMARDEMKNVRMCPRSPQLRIRALNCESGRSLGSNVCVACPVAFENTLHSPNWTGNDRDASHERNANRYCHPTLARASLARPERKRPGRGLSILPSNSSRAQIGMDEASLTRRETRARRPALVGKNGFFFSTFVPTLACHCHFSPARVFCSCSPRADSHAAEKEGGGEVSSSSAPAFLALSLSHSPPPPAPRFE